MEYEDMMPHQQRVVDEQVELEGKISKLKSFINESPIFAGLDRAEQKRLYRQFTAMSEYNYALGERIEAFVEAKEKY